MSASGHGEAAAAAILKMLPLLFGGVGARCMGGLASGACWLIGWAVWDCTRRTFCAWCAGFAAARAGF